MKDFLADMSVSSTNAGSFLVPLKICVYAFSSEALFFRGLIDACVEAGDSFEWSVIHPQGHFRYLFSESLPEERQCYLYASFKDFYRANNSVQMERAMTSGEGLITALFKDKDGYRWLDKDEQLRRGSAMDAVYRAFLERVRPDYVLFPDLEVVDGFVLMNLCREMGIGVLYFTNTRLLHLSFFATDPYETLPPYFGAYDSDDIDRARIIIGGFESQKPFSIFPPHPPTLPEKPSWIRRLLVSPYRAVTLERLHASEQTFMMHITRNILGVMKRIRRLRFEMTSAHYFDIQEANENFPGRYVLYALQYTPESSINGLEPYYVDQFRVIDALLLNLPAGYRLVVKEHPAMCGIRPPSFYRELRRRPGVLIVHPDANTRKLIERAAIVTTVTGTIGLEAYLLDKPSVLFGRTFFSSLCYRAPALSELRVFFEGLLKSHVPATAAQKEIELAKLLHIGGNFLISDPWFSPTVMATENIRAAREYLKLHMTRLGASNQKIQ